jgi:hypothetical protein
MKSELKYILGPKVVMLKYHVVGGKTGPFTKVRVFVWQSPLQWFISGLNPNPEPFWWVGTIADTINDPCYTEFVHGC